jgi:type I restriction-modification system DNA methylase subunit
MTQNELNDKLWKSAEKLRAGGVSPADYKYTVLGIVFLKYVSDSFETQYKKAVADTYDPEDKDYYKMDNIFYVPKKARWSHISKNSKTSKIGKIIDDAMEEIEKKNPSLNGSMSSQRIGEGDVRKNIIDAGLVDMIVSLSDKLFFNVTIPCCLWFVSRDRANRKDKTLFVDARNLGKMLDRKHRTLTNSDVKQVSKKYRSFVAGIDPKDELGFCKVVSLDEIKKNDYILTPGRFVGFKDEQTDTEPFEEKFPRLKQELAEYFKKGSILERRINENLKSIKI